MPDTKIGKLREMLDESRYTVAICGSGMMAECGFIGIKKSERAYEIESRYGASPEELFTSMYYNTRPHQFFDFYRNEMVVHLEPSASFPALAALERAGKLQCVITGNIYEFPSRGGCQHVINLHGSIYQNKCPRCDRMYPVEYVKTAKEVPLCENCKVPVRPLVSLFGEMVDSQIMTRTTEEIEKADMLLLLGTTMNSEVFDHYFHYFEGKHLAIIHQEPHYSDSEAELVILDEPKNVLPLVV